MSELGPDPQPPPARPAQPEPAQAVDPPEEPDPVPPAPWRRAGPLGAMLCLAAAALTTMGSFQDLYTARPIVESRRQPAYAFTGWEFRVEFDGTSEPNPVGAPPNWATLMFAVAALLTAAVLGMLATRASARRLGWVSGLTAVVAAAFLAATVAGIWVQQQWWRQLVTSGGADANVDAGPGPGFWTLVAATALAVAAGVVAWRPAAARPEPEREEPETPPLGMPAVVVRRLPDAPPDKPDGD